MRKLKTSDVLSACRLLKRCGLKERVREIAGKADTAADAWSRGFDLIYDIFDAATEAQGEAALYDFLAGPLEMTAQQVADLPIPDLFAACKQLAEDNDLRAFFGTVRSFLTR